VRELTLYEQWKRISIDQQGQMVRHVWDEYLAEEKNVYKGLISKKQQLIEGTLEEVAASLGLSNVYMTAFLDGIQEAVDGLPQIEEVAAETKIKLEIDFKRLYKQMVEYKAEDLYNLKEWNDIFTEEEQKEFYLEQKRAHTVVRGEKVGRNSPCTCGSGKKYKRCCGAA